MTKNLCIFIETVGIKIVFSQKCTNTTPCLLIMYFFPHQLDDCIWLSLFLFSFYVEQNTMTFNQRICITTFNIIPFCITFWASLIIHRASSINYQWTDNSDKYAATDLNLQKVQISKGKVAVNVINTIIEYERSEWSHFVLTIFNMARCSYHWVIWCINGSSVVFIELNYRWVEYMMYLLQIAVSRSLATYLSSIDDWRLMLDQCWLMIAGQRPMQKEIILHLVIVNSLRITHQSTFHLNADHDTLQ